MAITDLPWFPIYADETLSDENFTVWTPAQRGAWVTLLIHCWKSGSVPSDIERLSRLCGCNAQDMHEHWSGIADRFHPHPEHPDRLISLRLEFERQKGLEIARSRSDQGKKAANARWEAYKAAMREHSSGNAGGMPSDALYPYPYPYLKELPPTPLEGGLLGGTQGEQGEKPKPHLKTAKPAKPRGRDFGIAALDMPPEVAEAFEKVWKAWPSKGWNYSTKAPAARRIDYAEAAKRFSEAVQFNQVEKTDGTRMTAEELTSATLAWLGTRTKGVGPTGFPNVPCIANFFSCVDGQKHHWKEAVLTFFGVVEEP